MQRYTGIVQLIGKSNVSTVSPHGIIQICVIIEHSSGDNQIQTGLLQDIYFIPVKNVLLPVLHRFYFRTLSMYRKTYFGSISQRIFQCINEAVGTLFININQSPVSIESMQHT